MFVFKIKNITLLNLKFKHKSSKMRLRLSLQRNSAQNIIPINYQYEISAAVYKLFQQGSPEFAKNLHYEGFKHNISKFKLFTFSKLKIKESKVFEDRIKINSEYIDLFISIYPEEGYEPIIKGIFNNSEISVGDKKSKMNFKISSIEKITEPKFSEEMTYKTISPILISYNYEGNNSKTFLNPTDTDFKKLFIQNLINKYTAYFNFKHPHAKISFDYNFDIEINEKIKSTLIKIKADTAQETKLKAYFMTFTLKAPVELQRLGYFAGFGEKNSLGFGCCDFTKSEE
jgi:CRISPR-associated endoribonuclease Cas6